MNRIGFCTCCADCSLAAESVLIDANWVWPGWTSSGIGGEYATGNGDAISVFAADHENQIAQLIVYVNNTSGEPDDNFPVNSIAELRIHAGAAGYIYAKMERYSASQVRFSFGQDATEFDFHETLMGGAVENGPTLTIQICYQDGKVTVRYGWGAEPLTQWKVQVENGVSDNSERKIEFTAPTAIRVESVNWFYIESSPDHVGCGNCPAPEIPVVLGCTNCEDNTAAQWYQATVVDAVGTCGILGCGPTTISSDNFGYLSATALPCQWQCAKGLPVNINYQLSFGFSSPFYYATLVLIYGFGGSAASTTYRSAGFASPIDCDAISGLRLDIISITPGFVDCNFAGSHIILDAIPNPTPGAGIMPVNSPVPFAGGCGEKKQRTPQNVPQDALCQFKKATGSINTYYCVNCRYVTTKKGLIRLCRSKPVRPPEGFVEVYPVKKVVNFTKAMMKHILDRFKTRSKQQVRKIWKEHCVKCELFNPTEETCMACGCYINLQGPEEGLNKLAWESEKCPHPTSPKF